ncbi:endonuclease G, mitochondrial-like [Octopus sinensis]|uniref:Endonuclease n=1 Tax=Octopus sinensis TaxID=2607531 RepID=A0A6P7SXB3_9MOLL|nr:endonuclease G, mitochondrial-like [Octopus sinensis]
MRTHRLLVTASGISLILGTGLGVCIEKVRLYKNLNDVPLPIPSLQARELSVVQQNAGVAPSAPMPGNRVAQIMKFGFPSMSNLRSYGNYVLSYDQRTRCPNWVFEHLTPESLKEKNADRKSCNFEEDPSIHAYFRATDRDFSGSGYDRGHMAAAANNLQSWKNLQETFYYSNVAPQVGEGFNRGIWNKLEKYVRSVARKSKNVYVCTGPLYLPRAAPDGKVYIKYEVIGKNHVAVPTHFFKVVLIENNEGEYELLSFMLPNEAQTDDKLLKYFTIDIEKIERAAGLLFFDKLPKSQLKYINKQENKIRKWS